MAPDINDFKVQAWDLGPTQRTIDKLESWRHFTCIGRGSAWGTHYSFTDHPAMISYSSWPARFDGVSSAPIIESDQSISQSDDMRNSYNALDNEVAVSANFGTANKTEEEEERIENEEDYLSEDYSSSAGYSTKSYQFDNAEISFTDTNATTPSPTLDMTTPAQPILGLGHMSTNNGGVYQAPARQILDLKPVVTMLPSVHYTPARPSPELRPVVTMLPSLHYVPAQPSPELRPVVTRLDADAPVRLRAHVPVRIRADAPVRLRADAPTFQPSTQG